MLRPDDRRRNRRGNKLSEWLNKMQQESWQLELVISGVAIFLLLAAFEPLAEAHRSSRITLQGGNQFDELINLSVGVLRSAVTLVTLGFIGHLVLRGLWIGAIGLRSVSGDFDFDKLRLQPRYERFLRGRMSTFDRYIHQLETYSSIAFSMAFLLFFIVIAIGLFLALLSALLFITVSLPTRGRDIGGLIGLAYMIGGFFYMLDFVTLGYLKRNRFT